MKRLIVNADDFGLHESINDAVEIAHNKGILTSASLSVNGDAFEHAVSIAKKNKNLGIGIHLTLIGERPIAPVKEIPSIVDKNGMLFEDHGEFCIKVLRKKHLLEHIAIECDAQINKFLQTGLVPTHVDSHRHMHLFPLIFRMLTPILKKYNIKKVRWLNIPWVDFKGMDIKKITYLFFVQYVRLLKVKEYKHSDYFISFFKSGDIDIDYLKSALISLKDRITEINFHPGKDNSLIIKRYGFLKKSYKWKCNWEKEFGLLLNSDIKKIIQANNISLVNYSHI